MYKLLICLLAITVPTSFLTVANPALAQRNNLVSTTQVTVNTITQQIAKLEVERAVESTRFISENPVIQNLDLQLANLRKRLLQLRPDGNKQAVNLAVSQAIKTKIAQLEIERANQATQFSKNSPVIVSIDAQIKSLRQRLVSK